MEYKTKKTAAPFLSISSIEEVKAKLAKSDEDLSNSIYTTHEKRLDEVKEMGKFFT